MYAFNVDTVIQLGQRAVAIALLAVLGAPQALAYSYKTCDGKPLKWNSSRATMAISNASFPVGSIGDQLLQDAMAYWNGANSKFRYLVTRDTNGTYGTNSVNEVVFGKLDGWGGQLAVAKLRWKCSKPLFGSLQYGLTEVDVIFDDAESWVWSAWFAGGGNTMFEAVAVHELGHALGLLHENRWMATMNAEHPHGGWLGHYREVEPLPDDRAGIRALYGKDGTVNTDIAASQFESKGSGTSGPVNSPTIARPGETVEVDFTFGNLGTTRQSFDIGFYLSTDDFIGPTDMWLATNYSAWADPGFLGTYTRTVTIPYGTPPGKYYLGYIIDPDNAVAESKEYNNNQSILSGVQIYVQ